MVECIYCRSFKPDSEFEPSFECVNDGDRSIHGSAQLGPDKNSKRPPKMRVVMTRPLLMVVEIIVKP